jgi:hypothetical protein
MRLQEEVQQSLESDSEVMDAASEDGERGFEPVTAQAFGPSAKPMSAEQPSMLFGDSFIAAMQNADATAEATRSENANIANGERAASGMATEEVEERNSERSVSNQTFGDAQTETIGGAADENESAGADNDEVFVGTDDKDAEKLKKVVDQLIQTFPNSWKEMVLSFGKPTKLSSEKRLRTYRKRMIKKGSVEIASRALRFAKFILQYQWENHLGPLAASGGADPDPLTPCRLLRLSLRAGGSIDHRAEHTLLRQRSSTGGGKRNRPRHGEWRQIARADRSRCIGAVGGSSGQWNRRRSDGGVPVATTLHSRASCV